VAAQRRGTNPLSREGACRARFIFGGGGKDVTGKA
jgi:hypothetical protein